ncbi:MAG: MFS transporter [Bacteroidales bacterium]|nr:MAG: MFS transporter [Bacteroidales bacterium]
MIAFYNFSIAFSMNKRAVPEGYLFSKGYTNYVFILLFLLYMFDYVDRMIVTSLFPFIKVEWNLTDTQLGALISAVYWFIVLLTIPASILVDRWSRRRTIGAMAAIWSLATAAAAFTKSFPQLFITRTIIGAGEAGYAPGGIAMISAMYPKEKRSWMAGIWNASIPLGGAVGVALGGFIAAKWGWRSAFGIVAIPGLILAILFYFIKDYKTVKLVKNGNAAVIEKDVVEEKRTQAKMSFKDIVKEFISKPSLVLTYFGMTGVVFVTTSLLSWLPSFFSRLDNIPLQRAGAKASLVMLLAIIGAPLGGYIADKWRKKRVNARLVLPAITSMIAALFAFLAFVVFDGTLQYVFLLLHGISVTMFIPAAGAVTQDLVHPGLRATSYAIAVIAQNLLGASAGPIVIGIISDKTDISTALSILPIFLVISSILFLVGSFYYKKDVEKVDDVPLEVWG